MGIFGIEGYGVLYWRRYAWPTSVIEIRAADGSLVGAGRRFGLHRAGADAGPYRCGGSGGGSYANRYGIAHGYADAAADGNQRTGA